MRPSKFKQDEPTDDKDVERWEAIEEATELLLDREPHEALHILRDVVKTDPRNPYAFYYIGTAMFEVGRFDAAIDAYEAAIRLAPRYLAARVGLSHALRIEGQVASAMSEARKVLELSPGDGDALFALGLALAAHGNRVEAVRTLRGFLRTHPELEVSLEARALLDKLGPIEGDDDCEKD